MVDSLRTHCEDGKPLRVLTTTYTNSTEQRALEELERLGAQVRVSYDTTLTRLHAKAWLFHRASGYSTAYVGSSNLTHSAQVTGLEWNVAYSGGSKSRRARQDRRSLRELLGGSRLRSVRPRPSSSGEPSWPQQIARRSMLSPLELTLGRFKRRSSSRSTWPVPGRHRNLLVAATGTGKTVMAAARLRATSSRLSAQRLLFVAHREEILDQSRATFRHALRDARSARSGSAATGRQRFEHVFASIQASTPSRRPLIDPSHFDVVIVDEFHHAAAPSYEAVARPPEPERAARAYRHARASGRPRRLAAISTAGSPPNCGCGTRSTRDTSRRSPTSASTMASTFARCRGGAARLRRQRARRTCSPPTMLGEPRHRGGAAKVADPSSDAGTRLLRECRPRPVHGRPLHRPRLPSVALWGDKPPRRARRRRCVISPRDVFASSSRSTSSTRASTFRPSTRCCCCARPIAPRCSCSSSAGACGRPRARRSARCSTSSEPSQGIPLRPPFPRAARWLAHVTSSGRS